MRYYNGGHNQTKFCYESMLSFDVREFKNCLQDNIDNTTFHYKFKWSDTIVNIKINRNYLYISNIDKKINIIWDNCNFGGGRPFFICPVCKKKYLRLVYMRDNQFACRICNQANYKSSRQSKKWFKICRLTKSLAKLKYIDENNKIFDISIMHRTMGTFDTYSYFESFLDDGIRNIKKIPKPKNMHYKTYWNIVNECIDNLIDIYSYIYKLAQNKDNRHIEEFENTLKYVDKRFQKCFPEYHYSHSPEHAYNHYGKIQTHQTRRNKNGLWIKRKEENQQT